MLWPVCLLGDFLELEIFIYGDTTDCHDKIMTTTTKQFQPCVKRYEGLNYFLTSTQEAKQYQNLLLGDIEPQQCAWTIQPLNRNPEGGYQPHFCGVCPTCYVITSHQEMEQYLGLIIGTVSEGEAIWTIPPWRHTAS